MLHEELRPKEFFNGKDLRDAQAQSAYFAFMDIEAQRGTIFKVPDTAWPDSLLRRLLSGKMHEPEN